MTGWARVYDGPSAAAGPWIRVDSGERPENLSTILYVLGTNTYVCTYWAADDEIERQYDGHVEPFTWGDKWGSRWARILPPEQP